MRNIIADTFLVVGLLFCAIIAIPLGIILLILHQWWFQIMFQIIFWIMVVLLAAVLIKKV